MFARLSLVVLVGLLAACASSQEEVDPNTPETCVTVDNSGGGGNAGRVYLIGENRERIRIGDVGLGRSVTECFRRSDFNSRYQLVVEEGTVDRMDPAARQNQPRALSSDWFYLTPGDQIDWNVRLNRITLVASGGGS